jgi:hypothetical protein
MAREHKVRQGLNAKAMCDFLTMGRAQPCAIRVRQVAVVVLDRVNGNAICLPTAIDQRAFKALRNWRNACR